MASTARSPVEDARLAILQEGFYCCPDPIIGQEVHRMDDTATPFASAAGLRFCKASILDSPVIRPILDSFFKWFGLGLYRSFGARTGDYVFKTSNPEAEIDCLLVHLWSKGAVVTFWAGSHRHHLPSAQGENNLWRVPRAALKLLGLKPARVTFEQGGYTIRDPRVAVEIEKGNTITFAFGTKEVVSTSWNPMEIPASKDIGEIVALMESANFGLNIKYIGRREET